MKREWTGRDTLLALLGTFAVVFAVNFYFIAVAVRTYPGEDVRHPYLLGAEFNQTIDSRRQQSQLGWKATIAAKRLPGGAVDIELSLRDRNGKPVAGEWLNATLRHPMNERLDRPIALHEVRPGVYDGKVLGIAPGAWDVTAEQKSKSDAPFETERRVLLP